MAKFRLYKGGQRSWALVSRGPEVEPWSATYYVTLIKLPNLLIYEMGILITLWQGCCEK